MNTKYGLFYFLVNRTLHFNEIATMLLYICVLPPIANTIPFTFTFTFNRVTLYGLDLSICLLFIVYMPCYSPIYQFLISSINLMLLDYSSSFQLSFHTHPKSHWLFCFLPLLLLHNRQHDFDVAIRIGQRSLEFNVNLIFRTTIVASVTNAHSFRVTL